MNPKPTPEQAHAIGALPPRHGALALDTYQLGMRFGSFKALDQVNLSVEPGTVHALLGENGAGKSTLVKCVAGFQRPTDGSILIDGREQDIANPVVARALGIGMVYQHFTLAPGMTVAENLLLAGGETPSVIRWKQQRADLAAFLKTTPFQLDLDARPQALAAGEKQKLELLKQLYLKPRLLILDEPTSVLTPQEADEVLGHVRGFARSGQCTVLIITHKFREVMAYADAVTVLRRGRAVHHTAVRDTTPALLAQAMVGDSLPAPTGSTSRATPSTSPPSTASGNPALAVQSLHVMGDRGTLAVRDVSLRVASGEILGVAGVSGNGQRELLWALSGEDRRAAADSIRVAGQAAGRMGPGARRALGLHFVPEERLGRGAVPSMSLAQNLLLTRKEALGAGGWIRTGALAEQARSIIERFKVKASGPDAAARSLSGGNLQKFIVGREISAQPTLLIVSQPTWGVDVGAAAQIRGEILALRDAGCAVLVVSEELEELFEISDRLHVIARGRLSPSLPRSEATVERIGEWMSGLWPDAASAREVQHAAA